MFNRITPEEKQRKNMQAEQLLGNELLNELQQKLSDKYLQMLLKSDPSDEKKRDNGYWGLRVLDDFKNELQLIIKTAKLK